VAVSACGAVIRPKAQVAVDHDVAMLGPREESRRIAQLAL
jgi:hypothetical protein